MSVSLNCLGILQSPYKLLFSIGIRQSWKLIETVFSTEPEDQQFDVREDAGESRKFAAIEIKACYDCQHIPIQSKQEDRMYLRLHKGYSVPLNKVLERKLSISTPGLLKWKADWDQWRPN